MSAERTLVTGGMGCIGAWVLAHLMWEGREAVSLDLSADRHRLDLLLSTEEQAGIQFAQADLADFDPVREAFQRYSITQVIHLAALQVPFCRADPVLGARVNVTGTVNVFEAARQAGLGHVAYASSVAVYGPPGDYPPGPLDADARPFPRTLYGVYKVANEGTARVFWEDHRLSSIALRPYTVYGLGRDQGLTSDLTKAMLAAARGEPFEIGFGGAMQVQWASDVARFFIAAAQRPLEGALAFHLDTPSHSVEDVIALIGAVKPGAQITQKETRLPFPEAYAPGASSRYLPQVQETALEDGIRQTMSAFAARGMENRDGSK